MYTVASVLMILVVKTLGSRCPETLTYHEGGCYGVFLERVVYEDALRTCEDHDSDLLTGHLTEQEKQLVMKANMPSLSTWVEKGNEIPEDNTRADTGDGCKAFYPLDNDHFLWNVSCRMLLGFVCKHRGQPLPPTGAPLVTTTTYNHRKCVEVDESSLQGIILGAHNEKRGLHLETRSLCWDRALQRSATAYAVYLGNNGGLDHSDDALRLGENIYSRLIGNADTTNLTMYYIHAVKAWYDEIEYYNWQDPHFHTYYGHFTQVVWASSRHVGCGHGFGVNKKGQRRIVIVCQYSPKGNTSGHSSIEAEQLVYRDNVKPLKVLN